jgi:hypothetical protein
MHPVVVSAEAKMVKIMDLIQVFVCTVFLDMVVNDVNMLK